MERLTDEIGLKACDNCKKCEHLCNAAEKAIEKLKDYEDKEENGLLVRLPCRVGATLYEPGRKQISEYKVKSVQVGLFAIWVELDIEKGICLSRIDGANADEIGKTVFLTQAEAEAKLKEMEGKMHIDEPRCDLKTCKNYLDGNCTRGYEQCNYPKYKALNDKVEFDGYTLCKVDEAVEKIENNRINETFVDSSFYTAGKCIEIIKEACK